jgi:hypothetical protein
MLFAALGPRKGEPNSNQQYDGHNGGAVQELTGAFFACGKSIITVPFTDWRSILNCYIRSRTIARTLER